MTEIHYGKMTDNDRDKVFTTLKREHEAENEELKLLLRYHQHELTSGTPEFERAQRLHIERLRKREESQAAARDETNAQE